MLAKFLQKDSNRILVLLVITFLCFINVVKNGYSLDDHMVTTIENQLVSKGLGGIKEIFTSNYSSNAGKSFEYRPLTIFTYAIEYQIFGFNASVSHLISLFFYTLLVLLVYKVLIKLLPVNSEVVFWITLLFSLHPLHNEVVVSLKNREEILVALFGFYSFYLFLIYTETNKKVYVFFAISVFFLGNFVKLTIGSFAFLILFSSWYFKNQSIKKMLFIFLLYTLASQIFYWTANLLLPSNYTRTFDFIENPLIAIDFIQRIPTSISLFFQYSKLFILPHQLLCYYGLGAVPIVGWTDFSFFIGLIIAFTCLFLFTKQLKERNLLGYGALIFLFLIFPYLNFPILAPGIMAERFAFLAVLGFSMLLIALLIKFLKHYQVQLSLILLISVYVIININRTSDWVSLYHLFEVDASKEIKSVKVLNTFAELNQIEANKHMNNPQEFNKYFLISKRYYMQAIKVYPQNAGAYNNLGTLLASVGDYKNAKDCFEKAISFGYVNADVLYNIAALFELNNEIQKAIDAYKKCLKLSPNYEDARKRLNLLEGNINSDAQ